MKLVMPGPPGDWANKYSPKELEVRLTVIAVIKVAGFPPVSLTSTVTGPVVTPAVKEAGTERMTNWDGGKGVAVGVGVIV